MSYSSFGIDSAVVEPTFQQNASPQVPSNEWIPPPASLTTIDYDGLDLNDEIFLNNQESNFREEPVPSSPVTSSNFNYRNLQSNLNSPEMQFTSPFRTDPNSHYSHRRRFSSAVEQLDRMSLQQNVSAHSATSTVSNNSDQGSVSGMNSATSDLSQRSSTSSNTKVDSSDQFDHAKEERTINPRELFGASLSTGSVSMPARYVLPSSMSSPSLGTIFKGMSASLDETAEHQSNLFNMNGGSSSVNQSPEKPSNATFVMNDECVSAITYWLNNTANVISETDNAASDRAAQDGYKSSRPGWRRNNSIQVLPGRSDANPSNSHSIIGRSNSVHKKRRQKSFNNAIPDIFANELASESIAGSTAADVPRDLPGIDSNNTMPMISPHEIASFTQGLEQVPGLGQDMMQDISSPNLAKQERGQFNFPSSSVEQPKAEQHNSRDHEHESPRQAPVSKLQSTVSNIGAPAAASDEDPKPFPCPECDKQFKRSEHLKRHIRSVHSNIRPFHCKYCEKKFSRSDNLAQHSKTHFKVNSNGTTTIVYGNPNPQTRGRKRSTSMTGENHMNVEA